MPLPRSEPKSVLVVEDDKQISLLICAALSLRGAKLTRAETFAEALVEVERGGGETIVLDLGLPDSTPKQTISSIAYLLKLGAGQVIVITGSEVTERTRTFAIQSGARDMLGKDDQELFAKIIALAGAYEAPA